MGDFRAQVAAVKAGEKRFLEYAAASMGCDHVLGSIDAHHEIRARQSARERVRAIPDGIYEAESFMDDDGISVGAGIPIRVRVERSKGDRNDGRSYGGFEKEVGGFYKLRRDCGTL